MTRSIRFPDRLLAALTGLMLPIGADGAGAAPAAANPIALVQSTYLMRCGGCHGIEGRSVPGLVPDLADQVGLFTCTTEGRDYMLRVPNVAMSRIDDDRLLAAVMNFVIFRLGGASTPQGTQPVTPEQVRLARAHPIDSTDLEALRAGVLMRAAKACAS